MSTENSSTGPGAKIIRMADYRPWSTPTEPPSPLEAHLVAGLRRATDARAWQAVEALAGQLRRQCGDTQEGR